MEQERSELIVLISTFIIVFITISLIVLFVVFQRRKNKLLQERSLIKKRFEREIAETQIEIREETLRNISWELHDNIGQLLTLAKIQLQHATPDNMHGITEIITKSLTEIRALSKSINPDFINNIKLKEALRLEIERFNRLNYIESSLTITGEEIEIDQKHGIIIFRMLQEFFSNTIKHSKASKLDVFLHYNENYIDIIAKDNGVGFKVKENCINGIGLQNIKARAELINAKATLKSEPEKGTRLIINYYI
ncbi:histidine kinase [Tenacibaculum sp. Bg11-29]|uniref:sensor histidine kinase n=1 Tax=Tenacibaculum sp. Bg11-29 TaxID=2058306 RepID=UPI000C338047|nr:ATP-binding protein [Tenacibaculum sp. Bg11-29]PKH49479.1 histidine kinase [Tenacibaculum sp. Bg11-29]